MKNSHFIIFQILVFFFSCSSAKNKDFTEVDTLFEITDSLLQRVQDQYDLTSENFYKLIDDSLYVDSILLNNGLLKSHEFYQKLEKCRAECEDIYVQTKKEIYFMQDQLESLQTEFAENKILEKDYQIEVSELKKLASFLEERVDSNILILKEKESLTALFNKDIDQ